MAFKAGSIYADTELRTGKFNKGLKSLKRSAVIGAAAIGAAFVAGMAKSIKAANEFQKSMSNVSTLIDETVISTQDLTLQLLKLDPELGKTTELTDALYQAFSAGAENAEEAMRITTDAAKFGKAALTDTFTAVDVLTTAVNAYGKETIDTTRASDIFFTTIKQGKITGDQLATSIGTSIPLFASAGISLEELSSGMAAMTKQGVSANVATTQLNSIVTAFLQPSQAMEQALMGLGFASGSAFLETEGLAGALKLIETNTDGDAAAMSELLPNIRALRGAMALTGVGGEVFNATLVDMGTNTGITDEAFKKQEKTFATYQASLDTLSIIVGNVGKAFLDQVLVGATDSNVAIKEFLLSSDAMDLFAGIAGKIAGAFAILKTIGSELFEVFKPAITEIWEPITEIFDELFGEAEGGISIFALLAGAMNIVTLAITVIGKIIKTRIEIIRDFILAIKAAVTPIANFGKVLKGEMNLREFREGFKGVGEAFKTLGTNFVDNVGDIFATVKDEIAGFVTNTEDLAIELTANVKTAVETTTAAVERSYLAGVTGQKNAAEEQKKTTEGVTKDLEDKYEEANDAIAENTDDTTIKIRTSWEVMFDDARIRFSKFADNVKKEHIDMIPIVEKTTGTLKTSWEQALDSNILKFKEFADAVELNNGIIEEDTKETVWNMKVTFEDYFNATSAGFKFIMNSVTDIVRMAFGTQTDIITNESNEQLDTLQSNYESQLTSLQNQFNNQSISQEQYDIKRLALEDKYNTDRTKLEKDALTETNVILKKQFDTMKVFNIAQVWIDAATATMGWWKAATSLGPIAGPIFATVMTAATGGLAIAQTAVIAGQEFVPARQEGGMASGLTRVNESGGEIVRLPDQSLVIPNDISKQIADKSGKSTMINVSFDGARISDDVSLEQVTDRVIKKLGKEMRLAG